MPNKWLILILTALALWVLMSKTTTTQKTEPKNNPQSHAAELHVKASQTASKDLQKSANQATNQKNKPISTVQQNILTEIENRLFSDDPYVELLSLDIMIGHCRDSFDTAAVFRLDAVNRQQQVVIDALHERCKQYQNQYPNVLSMNEAGIKKAFKPNSQFGQLLQQSSTFELNRIEREEQNKLVLHYALREQNSSLLMMSGLMHKWGGGDFEHLKGLLNSGDVQYIAQISQLALSLLACNHQNGQTCMSTSALMLIACAEQPTSCNQDFPTWYQQSTLPGMKRDVEKLMAYYQQFSL